MNTEVNYEIAKLLAEKGFPQNNIDYETISTIGKDNNDDLVFGETYACPNISQVVMWLYKKHDIWIVSSYNTKLGSNKKDWFWVAIQDGEEIAYQYKDFSSPEEAYLSAIEFTLNNLI